MSDFYLQVGKHFLFNCVLICFFYNPYKQTGSVRFCKIHRVKPICGEQNICGSKIIYRNINIMKIWIDRADTGYSLTIPRGKKSRKHFGKVKKKWKKSKIKSKNHEKKVKKSQIKIMKSKKSKRHCRNQKKVSHTYFEVI